MKPLAIDLYCGLGGWTEGLLAEGYDVVGFDNERHVYGDERYPAQLMIQDVLTIHGGQFKDAALIVGSSPCQEFSYRAMPWKRAKALPPPYLGMELFNAQFRIQAEAIEAAGHFIPLVVENVRGAQKYVGRSKYHFGSFHLWGDVPALMPSAMGRKNNGGSWFAVANNTTSGPGQNPDGRKVPAFRFDGSGKSFQSAAVEHTGTKNDGSGWRKNGTLKSCNRMVPDGMNDHGGSWFRDHADGIKQGGNWFNEDSATSISRRSSSKPKARKRASAMIAKIPLVLSRHIAAAWYPC